MDWFINDLSLSGQYATPAEFRVALEAIIRLREQRLELRARIYCSRLLHMRRVTPAATLREAVLSLHDQVFKRLALGWFANSGPFWDATRTPEPEDYFHFETEDVTDMGLGEAARRQLAELNVGTFSFVNSTLDRFQVSPLTVLHGLPEIPLGEQHIVNVWETSSLAVDERRPLSWLQMLEIAKERCPLLMFSSDIGAQLKPHPYSQGRAERTLELLRVLQKLCSATATNGEYTNAGFQLYKTYFTGSRPWFTDSSDPEKLDFRHEMTFPDPEDHSRKVFCPWHGKAKVGGQFRLHFEWPRPAEQQFLKVMYIGPKLTKR